MRTHSPRTVAVVLVLVLASPPAAPRTSPRNVIRPVQLAQVKLGGAGSTSVFAGEVKPRYEADLGFRIGGKLVARYVDVGARVKKGQALARIDPADVGLQAEAAKAQVAATETEWKFAQAEYDRYQGLLKEKFISASALDAKRNTLDANRAKYEQAKANLAVAQNQASYATLNASDDGVITAVNADSGQVVTAGQSVFRLARAEEREVAISVPENRIGELTSAKRLVVALWANPQKLYPARVREVSPSVDATTRTFAVRVAIGESGSSGAMGDDRECRRAGGWRAERRGAAGDIDLSAGRQTRRVALRPRHQAGEPRARDHRPVSRGRRGRDVGRARRGLDCRGGRAQAASRPGGAAL